MLIESADSLEWNQEAPIYNRPNSRDVATIKEFEIETDLYLIDLNCK